MTSRGDRPFDDSGDDGPPPHQEARTPRDAEGLAHWCELVHEQDLGATIARIVRDPWVDLEARVIRRLRATAALFDTDRVMTAAAARLSLHASEYSGTEPLNTWLDARVDQAIQDLRMEDEFEAAERVQVATDDSRYARLARRLGVDAPTMRAGSIVFHRMPHEERAAFWAILIDGESIEALAAATSVPVRIARQRFERAVLTFCTLGKQRNPPDRGPQGRNRRRKR